jgi:opacity protein-like surface antigen
MALRLNYDVVVLNKLLQSVLNKNKAPSAYNMRIIHLGAIIASLSITATQTVSAGTMPPPQTGDIYFSIFGGGGGAATNAPIKQKGTSNYNNAIRPIDVNARGNGTANSAWIIGGQIGYQWLPRQLTHTNAPWTVSPATELEGYYIGNSQLTTHDINNNIVRLAEHDFSNTFPMSIGVFLINAVLHVNHANWEKAHPYIGVGVGGAVTSISNATSFQTAPPEPNINHFNGDPNASGTTFAAQPKVGVIYTLNNTTKLFAEYRLLCLGSTNYLFGSTVYQTHNVTSPWNVSIGSHLYNFGTVGVRYDV